MSSSTRIKGTGLSFLVDGQDYWADATSVVMDGQDAEVLEWPEILTTRRVASWFDVEAVQSTDAGSLWTLLATMRGEHVPFAYAPHANPVPTEDQPHFTGIVALPSGIPTLGGAAGRRVEQVFAVRIPIAQGPLRVTTT